MKSNSTMKRLKRLFLARATMTLLAALLGSATGAWAQDQVANFVEIGNGTSADYSTPFNTYFKHSITEQLYTAEEIGTAGTITSISFYYTGIAAKDFPITVYMMNTEAENLSTGISLADADIVFEGTLSVPATEGWVTITLNPPFAYDGTSNLLIGFNKSTSDYITGQTWRYTDVNNMARYSRSDGNSFDTSTVPETLTNKRPNIRIGITPGASTICSRPNAFEVTNVTSSSATLTWSGGSGTYNVHYKEDSDTEWTAIATNTTDTTFDLTDLTPITSYQVQVQSVCDADDVSSWKTVRFRTTPVAETVGDSWSDGFEGAACGWQLINGTCANQWVWGEAANKGGTKALYISNDEGTNNVYANNSSTMVYATKFLTFSESKYEFSYDWKANGESTYDYLRVALVPATVTLEAGTNTLSGFGYNSLPTSWIALDGGSKLNLVNEWQKKSVAVNVAAGNYYLVMAWRNDGNGGYQKPAAIDNVSISRFTCGYDVDGLDVTDITTTSATLSWDAGEATQWQVAYSDNSNFESATTAIVEEATYSISSLQPSTHYYARVRAYCGGDDYGAWSEVLQFNTDCETITTFPWTENFDSYTAGAGVLPMCWSRINTTTYSSYSSNPHIYNYLPSSSPNCLYFYSSYQSVDNLDPQPQYAILPAMEGLNGKMITLKAKTSIINSTFKIGLMTDPGDATTFTKIAEQALASAYQEFDYYIPADATASYVAIMIEAANAGRTINSVYIDDITIKEAPTCKRPTGLAASNPTAHGATLSWMLNDETQTTWEVQTATDEDFKENVQLIQDINNHEDHELSGLDPETTYYVRVRANCGDGDVSKWSNPTRFTTTIACPAPTRLEVTPRNKSAELSWDGTSDSYKVSYRTAAYMDGIEEGFGTSIPSGWEMYTGKLTDGTAPMSSATYGWSFGTNNGVFDNHARVNIYGNNQKWLVMPAITVPAGAAFSFDLALTAFSGNNVSAPATTGDDDRFIVLISTDNKTTWTILREWNNEEGSEYVYNNIANTATGENVSIDLSDYVGQSVRIAFYGESTVSNADNNLHIDNVLCGTLHPAGEWQTVTVDKAPATISGLTPETLYDVKVQGDCGDLDGLSLETAISFTTLEACLAPTDLAVSNITTNSATLSWTENNDDEGTSWVVAYKTADEEEFTEVTANSNPFTLTDLAPETAYTAKVRAVVSDGPSNWTADITFTTLKNNPMPTNLAASDITPTAATISWRGFSDSYLVALGTLSDDAFLLNENFDNEEVPANWSNDDNYPWTIVEQGNGFCLQSGNAGKASSSSSISVTVTFPTDDTVKFDAQCMGEGSSTAWDKCIFLIDGEAKFTKGANGNQWDSYSFDVAAGKHTFTWQYTKDSSVNGEGDHFAIDNVVMKVGVIDWNEPVSTADAKYTFENLSPGTPYYVKVVGVKDEASSEESEALSFTTLFDITLANDDSEATERNSAIIAANDRKAAQVTLADRTLYKDGFWNTLCLPFNLVLEGSPLAGAKARTLDEASISGTTLILNFGDEVTELVAGTPYIIKWVSGSDIVNPVFNGVTIDKTMNDKAFAGVLTFKGNYDYQSFDAENKSILFMDGEDTLNWPKNGARIGACRAYFQLADGITAGDVKNARLFFGSGDTQGIISIDNGQLTIDDETRSWYTVNGVKVEKPKRKGLYIQNGKKVVIK